MSRNISMDSKIVLVTGATSGFGKATAQRFADAGSKVIITGRRRERLETLKDELGERATTLAFDVRDNMAVKAAIASLPEDFSQIDVLVNNAGLALGLEAAQDAHLEDWDQMIDTNIKGLVYCTRAILPGMVERDSGHIFNIGSVAGTYPYPGGNVYGATKSFVHQFSLNLRADVLGKNIRVTSIEPGLAETEFSEVRFKGEKEKAAQVYKGVQAMSGEDVAEAIYWAAAMPGHVNINVIEMMATMQAFSPFAIHRKG